MITLTMSLWHYHCYLTHDTKHDYTGYVYFMFMYHCWIHTSMCYDHRHRHFMYLYYCYTDTLLYQTLLFHAHVTSLHEYSITLDFPVTWIHMYACSDCLCVLITWIIVNWIFLYNRYLHISWIHYMIIFCIIVLIWNSCYLTYCLLIFDVWN